MNILIVDDEEIVRDALSDLLRREGFQPQAVRTGEEALLLLEREEVDVILLDIMLPGMGGFEVLRQIRSRDPDQVVIVVTAYSSIEGAITAMRDGAFHYISKPFKNEEVVLTIRRGLEQRQLTAENRALRAQLGQRFGIDNIIGKSAAMRSVYDLVRLAAPSRSNILVLGESGTGKELVAKAIHHHSHRRAWGPFITFNLRLDASLICSRATSSARAGAFTGAIANKKGFLPASPTAARSSHEIGNIPLETQAKLLRVIQEKEFMHVGGVDVIRVDVRIIAPPRTPISRHSSGRAASGRIFNCRRDHDPAARAPRAGGRTFRCSPATSSPAMRRRTRSRPGDLPAAMELLLDYRWPGNVRGSRTRSSGRSSSPKGRRSTSQPCPPRCAALPKRRGRRPCRRRASRCMRRRTYERKLIVRRARRRRCRSGPPSCSGSSRRRCTR